MSDTVTNWKRYPPDAEAAYYAGYEDARLGTRDRLASLREHARPEDLAELLATYRNAHAAQTFGWEAIPHMRAGAGHGAAPDLDSI